MKTLLKAIDILIVALSTGGVVVALLLLYGIAAAVPSISVDQPSIAYNNGNIIISTPFKASNPSPFAISDLSLNISIEDSAQSLVNLSSRPLSIPPGAVNYSGQFDAIIDLSNISRSEFQRLLSDFDILKINATVTGSQPPFSSTTAEAVLIFPWSPPMANLKIPIPELISSNSTHFQMQIPISFDDLSSQFPLSGNVTVLISDQFNNRYNAALTIYSPPEAHYTGYIGFDLTFPPPSAMATYAFNGTSLVFNMSVQLGVFNLALPPVNASFEIPWGATFKDCQIGEPTIIPINSSHSRLSFPFVFLNENRFITVNGTATASLLFGNTTIAASAMMPIFASSGSNFSSVANLVVPNIMLELSGLTLSMEFRTAQMTVSMEVRINA
ncbi:MAG: hypothetical protein LUP94_01255 [Candidatus Methanomethylicus sp.]|nr:hypothetical protein [Candidatus Methanomethylicus sp.]